MLIYMDFGRGDMLATEDAIRNWVIQNPEEATMTADQYIAVGRGKVAKSMIRKGVAENVGDTESILGDVADVTQILLLYVVIEQIADAQAGDDYAKYRQIKTDMKSQLLGELNVSEIGGQILNAIQTGDLKLTASIKEGGIAGAIMSALTRSTGVVNVIAQVQS